MNRDIRIFRMPTDRLGVVARDSKTGRVAFAHGLTENTDDFLELARIALARLVAIIQIEGEDNETD